MVQKEMQKQAFSKTVTNLTTMNYGKGRSKTKSE